MIGKNPSHHGTTFAHRRHRKLQSYRKASIAARLRPKNGSGRRLWAKEFLPVVDQEDQDLVELPTVKPVLPKR